jgi:putative addiction module killer protein
MRLQAFVRDDGSILFEEWLEGLDSAAASRVIIAQARLTAGNTSNVKWFGGIGEYKINWGPGYRIYFVQDGVALIILFVGGMKKSQQADIALALMLNQEYQRQKQQITQAKAAVAPQAPALINPKKRRKKR